MGKRRHVLSLTKKDFKLSYYRASGKGGQHRNKTDSAVRIIHSASGALVTCETHKSQHKNKREAFSKFKTNTKFMDWVKVECEVSRALEDGDIVFEVKDASGDWAVSDEL